MASGATSTIPPWLAKLTGKVHDETLQHVWRALRADDTAAAAGLMKRSNSATRLAVWGLVSRDDAIEDHTVRALVQDIGPGERDNAKRAILDMCLQRGWTDDARRMIEAGAPVDPPPHDGKSAHDGGPLARLAYDEYPNIAEHDRAELARAMMLAGDMTQFNPGMIVRPDVLEVFLDLAPSVQDTDAWKRYLWSPATYTGDQVSSNTDPSNVITLLEAGFPGIPIDLAVRAWRQQNHGHAMALLEWAGERFPTLRCEGLESARAVDLGKPVLAEGFWAALMDLWMGGMHAGRALGLGASDIPETWPRAEALDILVGFDELDPGAVDENGHTLAQVATKLIGEPGPIMHVLALKHARRMQGQTDRAGEGRVSPRPRL